MAGAVTSSDWIRVGAMPLLLGLAALTLLAAIVFSAANLTDEEADHLKTLRQSGPWVLSAILAVALLWAGASPHSAKPKGSAAKPCSGLLCGRSSKG